MRRSTLIQVPPRESGTNARRMTGGTLLDRPPVECASPARFNGDGDECAWAEARDTQRGLQPTRRFALDLLSSLRIPTHRVSKSRPLSEPSPDPAVESQAADPLGLGRTKRSKRLAGGPIVAIVAVLAALVLAIGSLVWLWQLKGRSALTPSAGVVVEPDPDPPVIAPPIKALIKPPGNELPAGVPLEKTLDALVEAAAAISDPPGPLATNERVQRWEIRFPTGNTPEIYARQLDALGIELGVIGGGERIAYASAFTKEQPERRDGSTADEQRFYMTWRSGTLRDLDNTLLSRAKIRTTDRIVAQFYPAQLESTLADLEKQFATPRNVAEVRHTVFALTAAEKSYVFRVAEQEYMGGEVKNADAKGEKLPPRDVRPRR